MFFCIPVRSCCEWNWILCQHGIPCVGVLHVCVFCVCVSASCSCPCRRMCHISLLLHYDIYLWSRASSSNTIRLWHTKANGKGSMEKYVCMYVCVHRITGLLFLWIVFSVAFAMVTRKYIHTYMYLQSAAALALCVCVCVTFVESLWLLAPLAYLNNIYVYLTSLCVLPSAVFCFPYKLSRTI